MWMRPRKTSGAPNPCCDESLVTQQNDTSLPAEPAGALPPGTRIVTTAELFGGAGEIVVLHNGTPYRLRITRQDKLILTK